MLKPVSFVQVIFQDQNVTLALIAFKPCVEFIRCLLDVAQQIDMHHTWCATGVLFQSKLVPETLMVNPSPAPISAPTDPPIFHPTLFV
ncbi:hypothetical protein I7I53_07554 [Histoplasma capsulatum var. duboisii H88]|uniref:Uncharacterized protein n=1 Tax=Ajellomyces capsulatus (strain H88) TaxID=544711 RepID=A0A8A1LGJ2_AJEC8|nr:hypothetical protein I7I53_07554 [Histoplasma capsulatum var. duboisii H88]